MVLSSIPYRLRSLSTVSQRTKGQENKKKKKKKNQNQTKKKQKHHHPNKKKKQEPKIKKKKRKKKKEEGKRRETKKEKNPQPPPALLSCLLPSFSLSPLFSFRDVVSPCSTAARGIDRQNVFAGVLLPLHVKGSWPLPTFVVRRSMRFLVIAPGILDGLFCRSCRAVIYGRIIATSPCTSARPRAELGLSWGPGCRVVPAPPRRLYGIDCRRPRPKPFTVGIDSFAVARGSVPTGPVPLAEFLSRPRRGIKLSQYPGGTRIRHLVCRCEYVLPGQERSATRCMSLRSSVRRRRACAARRA